MASSSTTTIFFTLSLLFSLSSCLPSSTILDAAEILSTSGFEAMAFNLELASQTLARRQTRSLTVFAPTDFAFKQIAQLPLSLLRYHLLPHAFSLHSLSSLPFGANIATLLNGHSLTVTTSNHRLSINNVTVHHSPVFDDGHLVIFRTDSFFDPYFQLPDQSPRHSDATTTTSAASPAACFRKNGGRRFSTDVVSSFKEASGVLRARGCSVMASVLDVQFVVGLKDRPRLTLFAPIDEALSVSHVANNNLSDCSTILRRHLVPCKIAWSDLVTMDEGTLVWTYERGFTLNVTKSSTDMLLLNGVPVVFPELYYSDWLVVHGLREVLSVDSKGLTDQPAEDDDDSVQISESPFDQFSHNGAQNPATEHYHFSVFH